MQADYVIVGGGSAGCLLANRLSADPANRVILLEAGGEERGFWNRMPAGVIKLLGNPKTDWCHLTEPDPSINGRRIFWNAGRLLGGGSAINGQVYVRGQRDDYDQWEKMGCTGWSSAETFPYFLKGERWRGEPSQAHGTLGELSVTRARETNPLEAPFREACAQAGLPDAGDGCAGSIDGYFHGLTNQDDGERCSAARAWLEPARGRPNLQVLTGRNAVRVLFDGNRAVGVETLSANGSRQTVHAVREVIVSSGATQSPAILMRSGIGPAAHLRDHGIEVLADRDQVGENLMDHPTIALRWAIESPTISMGLQNPLQQAWQMTRYVLSRRGWLTSSLAMQMAGIRTSPELAHPDVLLSLATFVLDATKPSMTPGRAHVYPLYDKPAFSIGIFVARPYSRGRITLRSASAEDKPVIQPNLLGDERDVRTLMRAGRITETIAEQPAFARLKTKPLYEPMTTDAAWMDYIRQTAGIGWHASGTCRMGGDEASVVDPQLRVRGVQGLRVIDASVMPVVVSTNTNAAAMMIAERGAAFVLEGQRAAA